MSEFMPELGQAAFSNGGWERHDLYGDRGYQAAMAVAGLVAYAKIGTDPTDNVGAEFTTPKFALRSYCWCGGDRPGHEGDCPPNFEMPHRNLSVRWYKHARRSPSANRPVSRTEWLAVIKDVLTALDDDQPGRSEAEVKAAVLDTFVEYGDEAGSGIHSWRCAYPDRYGPCSCREEFAADVAARVAGTTDTEGSQVTMSDATEVEVESVARALAQLEPGEDWLTDMAKHLTRAADKCCQCDDGHHEWTTPYGTDDGVRISRDDARRIASLLVLRDQTREAIAALDAVRARSEAEIKAEALREAAEAMRLAKEPGHRYLLDLLDADVISTPDVWLERRAARLAKEGDQ